MTGYIRASLGVASIVFAIGTFSYRVETRPRRGLTFEELYGRRADMKNDLQMMPDESRLKQLNEEYVEAFMKADVHWYQEHLADDFVCIESDGALLDKAGFLRLTAKGPDVLDYRLDQVRVRIYGDVALVQAAGLFTRKDGTRGMSRYTDVYARDGKEWKVVSAQVTRTSSS